MTHRRILSILLCTALICALAGFAFVEGAHDHDHAGEALEAVLASPLATVTLGDELVPLSSGADAGYPNTPTDGHVHNWVTDGSEVRETDCVYGNTWVAYQHCTLCGARQDLAYRPEGEKGPGHQFVETPYTDGICPKNTLILKECSVCHATVVEGTPGHAMSGWSEVPGSAQCGGKVESRSCTRCGYVETRSVGNLDHKWVNNVIKAATCSTEGQAQQVCSVCGTVGATVTIPKTAHTWPADDGDCTTPVKCTVCGTVSGVTKTAHHLVWDSDDNYHWAKCSNAGCTYTESKAKHTGPLTNDCTRLGKCPTCGRTSSASGMEHNFNGKWGSKMLEYHTRYCSNPGCTQVSPKMEHTPEKPLDSYGCTETIWCVCGTKIRDGLKNHTYGPWVANGSRHTRTCTRCGQTESASHTGKASGNCTSDVVCTTCGYVLEKGHANHEFGVWLYANASTHVRTCSHAGCTAQSSAAHTGGKATCVSAAVCRDCGALYGTKDASNHAGGTQIRNAKAATVGADGYTGDTYCRGCGALISKGKTIPALAEDHKHSFSSWKSDGVNHWKECSCGERSNTAAHSFINGKCSVCGAADANYKTCSGSTHVGGTEIKGVKAAAPGEAGYTGDTYCLTCGKMISRGHEIPALAEDHKHSFGVWKSDGVSHWKECSCGEHSDTAAHSFVNGKCSVCGAKDPNAQEVHIHTYGGWKTNGQEHWRECTVCGAQVDRAEHKILNGSCLTCGMTKVEVADLTDVKEDSWYYASVKKVVESGLVGDIAGDEFKPEEKASRGLVADILYRLAGSPEAGTDGGFQDVTEDLFYADAVSWVSGNGILSGEGGSFNPEDSITINDVVTVLQSFAQHSGLEEDDGADAMAWAEAKGLLEGMDSADQNGEATRAEVAALLTRFMDVMNIDLTGQAA